MENSNLSDSQVLLSSTYEFAVVTDFHFVFGSCENMRNYKRLLLENLVFTDMIIPMICLIRVSEFAAAQ